MDNKDIAKEWFDIAQIDLSSAEFLMNMHPKPLEIICYHCHQSAEKNLKGFLALEGEQISKTHDLVLLNKMCFNYYKEFKEIEEDCLLLTDYSVNLRYPFHIEINITDTEMAIEKARKVKNFVLNKANMI